MKSRIEWIDVVKATSVLLVVFMHATNAIVDLGGPSWAMSVLVWFNHLVEPLRMPIFFLVSGMLASSAVHRPWSKTLNRTTGMIYLYIIWILLFLGFTVLLGASLNEPFTAILFAKSGYWYLYAMALFFILARLLRNQPAWLVVAVAIVPNLLRPLVDQLFGALIPGTLFTSMTLNIAFFLAGAYFKEIFATTAQKATMAHTIALGALSVVTSMLWMNMPAATGQSYFLLSVVWVAFGISLAVQLTRNGAPAWATLRRGPHLACLRDAVAGPLCGQLVPASGIRGQRGCAVPVPVPHHWGRRRAGAVRPPGGSLQAAVRGPRLDDPTPEPQPARLLGPAPGRQRTPERDRRQVTTRKDLQVTRQ